MSGLLYVTIIAVLTLCLVLTRLYHLKKEIKSVTRQLHDVNNNITEKKIDIRYIDKDFEKLAAEINHQMDSTKMAKAQKRMTENELKQAISYISHDIRTPMTSILGYIQLMESDGIPPEKKKEYLHTVKQGAKRLKVLLEDFFELSLIEQEDYPLKFERIKLNQLILEVLAGFYEDFRERNLQPLFHIPEEDFILTSDPSAVKRVVENLVGNASRYSGGQISIQLQKNDSSVRLTVTNTVSNLKEQDLQHMFDRFYKADQTRAGKGTGLGLPIVKSLMEKMDGSLSAELRGDQLTMKCEWKLSIY
ncbi:Alkaline phosphatase synthesis sensor protein PhoR [compost metagenome]